MKLFKLRRAKKEWRVASGEWQVSPLLLAACVFATCILAACTASPPADQPLFYLDHDADGVVQLYQIDADTIAPAQLTDGDADVLHVAVSPDGAMAAYATTDAIWVMDAEGSGQTIVLDCLPDRCNQLVWHPDGRRLLYERAEQRDYNYFSFPRLFWLDTATGDTIPLLENETRISQSAAFSPDGVWVAYVGSPDVGMQLFNLETGELRTVRTEISTAPVWSADSQMLYFRDRDVAILHEGEGDDEDHTSHDHSYVESVYLFSYALNSGVMVQLTDGIVDDGRPALSPDGEWIAFGRKPPRTNAGREIWLMRRDGSDLRQLTPTDPTVNYGGMRWGENGRFLLLQRYQIDTPSVPASLWLFDVETSDLSLLQSSGFLPVWANFAQ